MKATELMIGDWVMQDDNLCANRPCKIKGFFDSKTVEVSGERRMVLHESHIKPIPLTAELLEQNGFVQGTVYKDAFVLETEDEHMILVYLKDRNYTHCYTYIDAHCGCLDISEMPINSVHELQHVLRLCEIDMEIEIKEE